MDFLLFLAVCFGLTVTVCVCRARCISSVENRILEAGSKIIEIDGTNVEHEIHENVVELLNHAGNRITLRIQKPSDIRAASRSETEFQFEDIRIVQIVKPINGLGFNIVGGEVNHQGTVCEIRSESFV